jgi:hypothetical protein
MTWTISPIVGAVGRVFDRLKTAIAELGYEAVIQDLLSPDLIGGEDSLLASEDVMVVPCQLADVPRPILMAVTKKRDRINFPVFVRPRHLLWLASVRPALSGHGVTDPGYKSQIGTFCPMSGS